MKNPRKSPLTARLARGRRRFERWRCDHKPPTRLPESLWSLAVELAQEYGLSRTSRTLRLDYNGLKKRLACSAPDETSPATPLPPFLELLPSGMHSIVECTLEREDAQGVKIRIHLKGRELPDLAALGRSLWSPDQ
jgi:hypothetical protein